MNRPIKQFNSFLPALVAALLAWGCASSGDKKGKEASTLALFLETNPDDGGRTATVPVVRASPVMVAVDRSPFLNERNLIEAALVDVPYGFAIQVRLDAHGALVLDSVTSANKGSRIVVYSLFTEGRWLAAPKITAPIKDGVFVFTPDATREEAERIVRGLNNMATALGNKPKKPAKSQQ
jgi:hypothetical protein